MRFFVAAFLFARLRRLAVLAALLGGGGAAAGAAEAVLQATERGVPSIRNFPPRTYASANQVWRSVIARDGTVFFGSNGSVLQFDGLTWTKIPVPNGLHVRALAIDAADTVWVGGVNELGRLVRNASGRRVYESLRDRVPAELGDLKDIWCAFATPDGVWFQSNQAALRWREGRFEVWPIRERSITLSFWLGDHLLVAKTDGWFRPGPAGTWEPLGDPAAKLGDYLPHFAVPHPAGGWLMGIEGPKGEVLGLARWDGRRLTFEPHPLDDHFKARRFYSANRLADGRYVVTTLQGGAVILGPGLEPETWLNDAAGLPSNAVIAASEDTHGALWLSTEFGISRVFAHPAYTWFSSLNGLSRGSAHPTQRWQGRMLVGSSNGVLQLEGPERQPGNARAVPWPNFTEKISTFALVDNDLMIGGLGGLWLARGGTTVQVHRLSNIFQIHQSRRNRDRVYAASLNGLGLYRRDNDRWVFDRTLSELRSKSLYEEADGTLWIGTEGRGAIRVRFPADPAAAPETEQFGPAEGLPAAGGPVKIVSAAGQPLFLSPAGLYRFHAAERRFAPEPAFGAALADGTTCVETAVEDARGGLWMILRPAGPPDPSAVKQLGRSAEGKWHQLALPDLERIDGISTLHLETVAGRDLLWINGQSSILRIDLSLHAQVGDHAVGRTVLEGVALADGRVLPADGPLRIQAADTTLRFRFGTPGLAGENDVRHESRLRGFGDGAPELSPAGTRTFTRLPAGHYVFEVRGRSADGRWSEPATAAFEVLAPWWQASWVWFAGFCGLAAGTYGFVRHRTRVLERERARLETVVAARTAELAQKNRELERLNRAEQDEKLAARLAEEKARLELLRYQLNPHFLFNSLNSIRALVYANPDAAGEMVTRLAEFCRWTLSRGSDETTTVAEEAEMARTYLEIEKVRWQEALLTSVAVDPAVGGERLPQFLLLPLIENAIKYGGRTSPATLEVRVELGVEGGRLRCSVANTGTWVEATAVPSETSTHIGLENLRQRLRRHYGADWDLATERSAGWVRMVLRFPRGLGPPGAAGRSSRHPFPRA